MTMRAFKGRIGLEDVVLALCQAVVDDNSLRITGPHTGYRCKATYSLCPHLVTSPLVMPEVNVVCEAVNRFRLQCSQMTATWPRFMFEVCVRRSRAGSYLLKIVFLNALIPEDELALLRGLLSGVRDSLTPKHLVAGCSEKTLFGLWVRSEERGKFVHFMQEECPSLQCIVAHVKLLTGGAAEASGGKPTKADAYLSLTTDPAATQLMEYTPNGYPFTLSSDAFGEVNQHMEDAMYETIKGFLSLDDTKRKRLRRAFVTGRDVNCVATTFKEFYDGMDVCTSCPLVHADALANGIPMCQLVAKHDLYRPLQQYAALSGWPVRHVLITAGRNGLHPRTSLELTRLATEGFLTDVIYVSCNVFSFARDLYIFKESFRVHGLRTFDFFPNTEYVMTVVHLCPLRKEERCRGLLLLPVGPPGAGKSTCGRALASVFNAQREVGDTYHHHGDKPVRRQHTAPLEPRKESAAASATCTPRIPRSFADLRSNWRIVLIERDLIFQECREAGMSLKQCRVNTHKRMLEAIRRWGTLEGGDGDRLILYVDSTNGSSDARKLYRQMWASGSASGPSSREETNSASGAEKCWQHAPWQELWFDCIDAQALLQRCRARGNAAVFPTDEGEQIRKVTVILEALQDVQAFFSASNSVHLQRINCSVNGQEKYSCFQVLVTVAAHLVFAPDLAHRVVDSAVAYVIKRDGTHGH